MTKQEFLNNFNPGVYHAFANRMFSEAGNTDGKLPPYLLFELVRWDFKIRKNEGEKLKLNNDYRAFYLRVFLHHNPKYRTRVTLKKSVADEMTAGEMETLINTFHTKTQ